MTDEPMEEAEKNPLLRPLHGFERKSRPRNRKLEEMILALGLRYHPTSNDMVQQHKAKLVALIEDLDGIPLVPLEKAIEHWKRTSAFLPKASDLIGLAASFARGEATGNRKKRIDQTTSSNAKIDADNPEWGYRWIQTEETCELMPLNRLVRGRNIDGDMVWAMKPEPPRCTSEQAAAIMKEFNINSSILDPIVAALKPAPTIPTADDYARLKDGR